MREREDLEEKLRLMRISAANKMLLEMNLEADFRTLCQVAAYNARHPKDPILPAKEK